MSFKGQNPRVNSLQSETVNRLVAFLALSICLKFQETIRENDRQRVRLEGIRQVNVTYLEKLGENQEGQRIKARSNVSIADKRLKKLEAERESILATPEFSECDRSGLKSPRANVTHGPGNIPAESMPSAEK